VNRLALLLLLALLAAAPAHAQRIYRCVDARGVVSYTEKPGPECKVTRLETAPTPPNPASKAPPPLPASATHIRQSASTPLPPKARCDALAKESASLGAGKSNLDPAIVQRRRDSVLQELRTSCR
jgi:hypothetical protein